MFLHLNPCWPGSAHDSRVFKESALYDQFEDGKHKGFLLGDSTYALRDYMMTPIMNPNPGPEERFLYFNQSNFSDNDFVQDLPQNVFIVCWKHKNCILWLNSFLSIFFNQINVFILISDITVHIPNQKL